MEIAPITLILVGFVCVVLGLIAGSLLSMLKDGNEPPDENVDQAPPGGRKGKYTPLARLWRERSSHQLVVELEGRAFIGPAALDEDQRAQLEAAARDLRAWLGMGLSGPADAGPVLPAASIKTPANGQPVPMPAPAAAARANRAAPAAVVGKEEPVAASGPKSIVMQIEDILQDMIAGTPIEQRAVHLSEDPSRGVIVMVGLERFEGIELGHRPGD